MPDRNIAVTAKRAVAWRASQGLEAAMLSDLATRRHARGERPRAFVALIAGNILAVVVLGGVFTGASATLACLAAAILLSNAG